MKFSYTLLGSDETKAIYQRMLEADADKVLAFRAESGRDLETRFRAWWQLKGPTGFDTVDDALQYKRELRAATLARYVWKLNAAAQ